MERVDYESLLISELFQDENNGNLNLNPWYQRREVWTDPQKAYLINTVFEQKPVPSIYVRHIIDIDAEKSIKEIVDGQQRVRAVLDFRRGKFAAKHPAHGNKRILYSDLTPAQKSKFLSSKLSVGYLIEADDRDVIEIFGRINSISKTLNPQEKRNALFSGELKQFALLLAADLTPFWRASRLFSDSEISRMQEVQFVSDLLLNMVRGLSDFSSAALDKFYREFDINFPEEADLRSRWDRLFREVVALPPELFSSTVFRSYQVAFSLLHFVDEQRALNPTRATITRLIRATDEYVAGLQAQEQTTERQRDEIQAFVGSNLHRIRNRTIRHEVLTGQLAAVAQNRA